jgi:hypothetical protein
MRTNVVVAVLLILALAFSSLAMAVDRDEDLVAEPDERIEWIKMGMILDIGNPGDPDSVIASGGYVIYDEGMYKMWYGGSDGRNFRVMYATSPNGLSWTKHGVAVDLGPPGAPDDQYTKDAAVLRTGPSTYRMWYTAQSSAVYGWRIMHATSSDGVNWIKDGVVFAKSGKAVAHPFVLPDGVGGYRMWFGEYDTMNWKVRYAVSSDGMTWSDQGLALDIGAPGDPDARHVYEPSVIIEPDGTHIMYYSAYDGNPYNYVDAFYAVSPNGLAGSWVKMGLILGRGDPGDYDDVQVLRPVIMRRLDGSHELFYTGQDGQNGRMMLAVEKRRETEATTHCGPRTLNLDSNGNWITCYIELPPGYDPRDIDATTILLNEVVSPELDPKYDFVSLEESYIVDHDENGIEERLVKFVRSEVDAIIDVGSAIGLTLTGELVDGTQFTSAEIIRVIDPPKLVPTGPEVDDPPFIRIEGFSSYWCYVIGRSETTTLSTSPFIRALLDVPEALFLDEPALGPDPQTW